MIPHMWRRLMKYTTVNVLTRSVVALFIPLRLQAIAARRWMNRSCKMWFLCDGIFFWCCVKLSVVYSVQSRKNNRSDLPTWKRRYSLPKLPFKMMSFDVMFFSSTQTHWVHWEHQKVKGFFTNSSRKNSPFSLHNMGSWETHNIDLKIWSAFAWHPGLGWRDPKGCQEQHLLATCCGKNDIVQWFATVRRLNIPANWCYDIHVHTNQRSTKNDPQRNLTYKLKDDKCNYKKNKQNNPWQSTLGAKPSAICVGVAFKPIEKISVPIGSRYLSGWTYHWKATPRTRK